MANPVGAFIWYELMTPDPDAAARFYGAVVGWTIAAEPDPGAGGMDYRMITRSDGGHAGGVLGLTEAMTSGGARPCWMPYLHVSDVDAAIAAIEAEGGKVQMPAMDLPVGRIAMLTDPQGVPIYIMDPTPPPGQGDMASDVFSEDEPQRVRWNELASPDQAGSMAFYARHFDFAFNDKMPMGAMGDYCFIDHHGVRFGAIMPRQNEEQPAVWLFYFGVPSIAEAQRAVEANGGKVLMGPMEVPTGDWIIVCLDPQGAGFGLVGAKGD
ncbi:VOC family protein [Novosphingobium album (ex Liu et al. 2023)]|uniref:VOC family protein n=1 Tax=Novosphingobium album (ex Liu et al. 2023) TaxID=3031130 RepID=A0ABT5WPJ2_9SPHN|nr:VOC family protein [Novosphingobium album (ex Liu et al. 2023)]MDE8651969.1 VOC family protein [Novosphingobium album (ex Liu et al. 2023)]